MPHSFIPDSSTRKLTDITVPDGAERERHDLLSPPEKTGLFSPGVRRIAGAVIVTVLAWVAFFIAFRGPNYVSEYCPGTDSGVFLSVGYHMDHGRVLYRDTWDHKPPLILMINAAALAGGGHTIDAVRNVERWFGVAGAAFAFLAAWLAFRRKYVAFIAAIAFTLFTFHPLIYQGGNLTEFYGVVFFLGAIAAAIASRQVQGWRASALAVLAGVGFGLGVLCKEPFLLTALPWVVYVAWPKKDRGLVAPANQHAIRQAFVRFFCLLAGAVVPLGAVIAYFVANGAVSDWIDVIAYNFIYAASSTKMPLYTRFAISTLAAFDNLSHISWLAMPAMGLGLASVASREFRRRSFNLPIVFAADFLLTLLATSLSGLNYGHYYMQLVPAVIMLSVCGLLFCVYLVRQLPTSQQQFTTAMPLALAAVVLLWAGESKHTIDRGWFIQTPVENAEQIGGFVDRLSKPFGTWKPNALVDYVRQNTQPGQYVWCPCPDICYVYAYSEVLSPAQRLYTFGYFFCDTPASTRKAKFDRIRDELQKNPPQMILILEEWRNFKAKNGLDISRNYKLVDRLPSGIIWRGNPDVEVWVMKP